MTYSKLDSDLTTRIKAVKVHPHPLGSWYSRKNKGKTDSIFFRDGNSLQVKQPHSPGQKAETNLSNDFFLTCQQFLHPLKNCTLTVKLQIGCYWYVCGHLSNEEKKSAGQLLRLLPARLSDAHETCKSWPCEWILFFLIKCRFCLQPDIFKD